MNPLARNDDGLLIQELGDELVVCDLDRDQVHVLDPTSALIWNSSDGSRTIEELATLLHEELGQPWNMALVELTLSKLDKANLMARLVAPRYIGGLSRREILRRLRGTAAGAAMTIPAVTTLVSPSPATAQSNLVNGSPCVNDGECASGCCCEGNTGFPPGTGPRDSGTCIPRFDGRGLQGTDQSTFERNCEFIMGRPSPCDFGGNNNDVCESCCKSFPFLCLDCTPWVTDPSECGPNNVP